jgi:hypothetical protein
MAAVAAQRFDSLGDFDDLVLGDARLSGRARGLAEKIALRPSDSFPKIFASDAEIEAFYRFTNNERVRAGAISAEHAKVSWRRAGDAGGDVLLLHDTTEHTFEGEFTRVGLSQRGKHQSFWSHCVLAAASSGPPTAFGVVGLHAYLCDEGVWTWALSDGSEEALRKGSDRWLDGVHTLVDDTPSALRVIHVADREGDAYPMFAALRERNQDFVIRAAHNRVLADGAGKLRDALAPAPHVVERDVHLSARGGARPPKTRATHPERDGRTARLALRGVAAVIAKPSASDDRLPGTLALHAVEVNELAPPDGADPIHWTLWTTLPIDTPEQLERVVDVYRRRWLIEEFFRSLKTGCAFSKRQAESLDALLRIQALLLPVAVRLLNLRTLATTDPKLPWSAVISERQLRILQEMQPKHKLTKRSNARAVMLAVAAQGGHLKSNGDPGWMTLGRGFEDLIQGEWGWIAAVSWMSKRRR